MSSGSAASRYLSASQKRSAVRVDVEPLPIEVWVCRLGICEPESGRLVNLSGSGALIEVERPLPPRLRTHCRFALPGQKLSSVDATVVRHIGATAAGRSKIAVHFDFLQEGRRDALIAWIFEELVRQRRARDIVAAKLPSP